MTRVMFVDTDKRVVAQWAESPHSRGFETLPFECFVSPERTSELVKSLCPDVVVIAPMLGDDVRGWMCSTICVSRPVTLATLPSTGREARLKAALCAARPNNCLTSLVGLVFPLSYRGRRLDELEAGPFSWQRISAILGHTTSFTAPPEIQPALAGCFSGGVDYLS